MLFSGGARRTRGGWPLGPDDIAEIESDALELYRTRGFDPDAPPSMKELCRAAIGSDPEEGGEAPNRVRVRILAALRALPLLVLRDQPLTKRRDAAELNGLPG